MYSSLPPVYIGVVPCLSSHWDFVCLDIEFVSVYLYSIASISTGSLHWPSLPSSACGRFAPQTGGTAFGLPLDSILVQGICNKTNH